MSTSFICSVNRELFFFDVILLSVLKKVSLTLRHIINDIEQNLLLNLSLNWSIDLFSLYILFSHFRPCDATRGNSFFQTSSYARANLRITNEKTKGKFP